MKSREVRFLRSVQLRATDDGQIEGYAAVFNDQYDSGYFIETIKPGAFSKVLGTNPDVRALFNHNVDHVLGRTKAGTLKLAQDDKGLRFTNTPPDTQKAKDVVALVKRGDIDGCSFSFTPSKTTWREEKDPNDPKRTLYFRDIEEFDEIFDVGPVTFPAYTGTSVSARSRNLGLLWPAGVPAEIRSHVPSIREDDPEDPDDQDEPVECKCRCRACYSGECNECEMHMASCGDGENCGHTEDPSGHERAAAKKTKRVDGEDLPASAFLYVGDPEKTATWSLPWKFSTDDKTKSHLRNALARFEQTKNVPADQKAKVWKKLVAKCKKYGIHVTDEEAKSWGLSAEQRKQIGSGDDCEYTCAECQVGNHDECSDPDCDDPNCAHSDPGDDDEEQNSARLRLHQHELEIEIGQGDRL